MSGVRLKNTAALFRRNLKKFVRISKERQILLYNRSLDHVERSIVHGSSVTGAPGQPKKSGDLIKSWKEEGSRQAQSVSFTSELPYAHDREDNRRGATQRSSIGGSHSVKITRVNYGLIIRHELPIVKAQLPN